MTALYEINAEIALRCVVLSYETILKFSLWINSESNASDIASRCEGLIQKALAELPDKQTTALTYTLD